MSDLIPGAGSGEPNEPPQIPSVGVIGLGLIGGSIGLALRSPKRVVLGCDFDPAAEKTALERFCVDRVATFEEVCACDVVFLGVPPETVVEVAARAYALKRDEAVITDCASVKSRVANWAAAEKWSNFVPGHPMAGHEKSGSRFSSSWMFKGARWILTPTESTRASATRTVKGLVGEMGAVAVMLKPGEHDRHVALLSHLPHVVAGALVMAATDLPSWEVGAGSWRDLTRVGGVDPGLWSQILFGNREELTRTIDEFCGQLQEFSRALGEPQPGKVTKWLERAKAAKLNQTPAERPAIDRSSRKKKS